MLVFTSSNVHSNSNAHLKNECSKQAFSTYQSTLDFRTYVSTEPI